MKRNNVLTHAKTKKKKERQVQNAFKYFLVNANELKIMKVNFLSIKIKANTIDFKRLNGLMVLASLSSAK